MQFKASAQKQLRRSMTLTFNGNFPQKNGLYDPANEKDGCGVGFVCDIKGRPSHKILQDAFAMNCCMEHRGGVGYEKNTGDGAGVMTGMPHSFFNDLAQELFGRKLPSPGEYGVGNIFLPTDPDQRETCKAVIAQAIEDAGQTLIGWRELPTSPDIADVGKAARAAMPAFEQLFVGKGAIGGMENESFERKLYTIRKHSAHLVRADDSVTQSHLFYMCSLSTNVIVYKGMLTPDQLFPFYPDLTNLGYESHMAMVHSRFSTNTFPSWDRAQPSRFMSHNGEINTLLGNINAMNAREGTVASEYFGEDIKKLFPIVEPDCSDSGTFDNVLEFLLMSGRTLPEALLMMIPEAWQQHAGMSAEKKAFYEYHSCLIEPWDGPASIAFSDGSCIGAVLDRNGLRPSRYYITDDDICIMASEVGVVPVDSAKVVEKGRLQPGRIFLIDFEQGRMIPDEELKTDLASRRPYQKWVEEQRIELTDLPQVAGKALEPRDPYATYAGLWLYPRNHAVHAATDD
jgi:glutamate synthase (NADPH/NADH) large chain